jgi:hypothetical protein
VATDSGFSNVEKTGFQCTTSTGDGRSKKRCACLLTPKQQCTVFYGLVMQRIYRMFADAQMDNNIGPYLTYNKMVLSQGKCGGRSPKFILGPMSRDVHS